MTDADATIMPGSLERINRWFSNPNRLGRWNTTARVISMARANTERSTLSCELENLLMTVRHSRGLSYCLEGRNGSASDMYLSANADDAQIATAVRLNGLRSIQTPI